MLSIDAPAGKNLVVPDITLAPGRPQHIRLTDPDGRPVSGSAVLCLQAGGAGFESIKGDEWSFIHANPGKAETLIFSHAARSFGATVDLKGDEPDPVRIVLQPCGTVTGRLVDEDGKPRPGVSLAVNQRFMSHGSSTGTERMDGIKTGPDGRFRIKNLVPGLDLQRRGDQAQRAELLVPRRGISVQEPRDRQARRDRDWGDVQARPYRP